MENAHQESTFKPGFGGDYQNENAGGPGMYNQNPYRPPHARELLKNSTATLVLGILSLLFIGGIGVILAIISLAISANSASLANSYPGRYRGEKNLKAGRVCSIISLCLAGFILLIVIFVAIGNS